MSRKRSKRNVKQSRPKQVQPSQKNDQSAELASQRAKAIKDYVYEGTFADVEEFDLGIADEKALQLLMRDWRKGRATRTIWDAITSGYTTVFSILVIGAMLIGGIVQAQANAATCNTSACKNAQSLVPWLLVAAMAALAISLSKLFGPVVASAAEGSWLLDAPINRARILRARLAGVLVLAFAVAAAVTMLVCMLTGLTIPAAATWAAAAGLAASAATGFVASQQGSDSTVVISIVQAAIGALTTVVLLAVIGVSVEWLNLGLSSENGFSYAALGAGALLALIFAVAGFARLNRLRRARLVSGGDLLSGMQGAAFALDFALMRDILIERKFLAKGQVKPARGRGTGTKALIWRDFQRFARNPVNVIILLVSAVVPYAVESLGMGLFGVMLSSLLLMFVMIPFFDSLRVLTRTKGLARAFPFDTTGLRTAATVAPGFLALLWVIGVTPAFLLTDSSGLTPDQIGTAFELALVMGATGWIAAIRWVSAKPPDYSSPMIATGMGAMPPGMIMNMLRGFDIVALGTLPLIFNLSPLISLVILLIAYLVMRSGGVDTEEMMERQAEAKKELAAAKKAQSEPVQRKIVHRSAAAPRRRP